jgi:hypothetical protein
VIIDCDTCVVRGAACQDCVVTVLLGGPPQVQLDAEEQRAVDVLAEAGLVPAQPEVSVEDETELPPVLWLMEHHQAQQRNTPGNRRSAERSVQPDERQSRYAG